MYVAFEGPDGSGKSTLMGAVASRLEVLNFESICTREPGGTPFGKQIRAILKDQALYRDIDPLSRRVLFEADRLTQQNKLVRPALDAGKIVLTDRTSAVSNHCYSAMEGSGATFVQKLEQLDPYRILPDLVVLVRTPASICLRRIAENPDMGDPAERDKDKFLAVHNEYAKLIQTAMKRNVIKTMSGFTLKTLIADGVANLSDQSHLIATFITNRWV